MASAGDDLPDDVGIAEDSMSDRLSAVFTVSSEEIANANHAGESMNAAMDAAEEFAALVVEAGDEGDPERQKAFNQAKAFLNQLCDAKSALGRKDVRGYWKEQITAKDQATTVEDGVPDRFEPLFCECLTDVTKTVLTDKKKDETEYELEFNDGRGTSMVIGHSTLMGHESAWKAYTSASGQYPKRAKTTADDKPYTDKHWQTAISEVIEDLETVEMEVGPRTDAYRSVENLVERSVAYEDMGDAVEQGGLWVGEVAHTVEIDTEDGEDGETETESRTVEELRVMREDIAQITSQHDVTDRGLQIELKARGLASPRVSGISESTYVNGSYQTYWCFVVDEVPDPEDVVDEVADPMDRMDDRDDDGGDEDSEDDDDDGDAPAHGDEGSDGDSGPDDAGASSEEDSDDSDDGSEEFSDETVESRESGGTEDSDSGPGKIGTFGGESGGEGE